MKVWIIAIFFIASGCRHPFRYALVHVSTVDKTSTPVTVIMMDAKTGLSLGGGYSNSDIIVKKPVSETEFTLSVIVFDKCYPAKWKIVAITKWVKELKQLKDAININKVEISLLRDSSCSYQLQ